MKQNGLVCLVCVFRKKKEAAAQIPRKPKEPDKYLTIPSSLCGVEESDDEDWANDIAKAENWGMKENIEKAITDICYKTKAEMTLIMRNYNSEKEEQEEIWEALTTLKRSKFFREQTSITKLRTDWEKGYMVTKKR